MARLNHSSKLKIDELFRIGRFDSIDRTAQMLDVTPTLVREYAAEHGYETNFRKRVQGILATAGGVGLLTGALVVGTLSQNRQTDSSRSYPPIQEPRVLTDDMLTLQNVRITYNDVTLGQAYLDKLVRSGRIDFQRAQVLYDPTGQKVIDYLNTSLISHPESESFIKQRIQEAEREKSVIQKYRLGAQEANGAQTIRIRNTPARIFVYLLPSFLQTDDDLLWILDHENCHAQDYNMETFIEAGGYTPDDLQKAVTSVALTPDFDELRCYYHQLQTEAEGKFKVSKAVYNDTVQNYKNYYTVLSQKAEQNDIEGIVTKQLLEKVFVDPLQFKLR